jgi:hypothetical protein
VFDAALDTLPPIVRRRNLRRPEDSRTTEREGAQPGDGAPPRGTRSQLLAQTIESSPIHEMVLRLLTSEPPATAARATSWCAAWSVGPQEISAPALSAGIPHRFTGLVCPLTGAATSAIWVIRVGDLHG